MWTTLRLAISIPNSIVGEQNSALMSPARNLSSRSIRTSALSCGGASPFVTQSRELGAFVRFGIEENACGRIKQERCGHEPAPIFERFFFGILAELIEIDFRR